MKVLNKSFTGIYKLLRKTSIFKRLLVSFLVVIICPSIILINFIYWVIEAEFYETGINYVYQNLDITSQKIYTELKAYEQLGKDIERDRVFLKALEENQRLLKESQEGAKENSQEAYQESKTYINNYLYEKAKFLDIAQLSLMTEKDYFEPIDINNKGLGGKLIDINYFKQSKVYKDAMASPNQLNWNNTIDENDMYCSRVRENIYLGNYITLTYKIGDKGQNIKALLVVNINVSALSGLANINKLYNQDLFLIDDTGIITYLSPYYNYYNFPIAIWEEIINQKNEINEYKIQGKDTLFVTQEIGKSNWAIVSIIYKDRFLQSAYDIKKIIIGVTFIMSLVSLGICIIVTYSISYPLKRFQEAMNQFAKEDFYIEYKDEGKDQITEVSNIFQGMVKRIRRLVGKQIKNEIAIKEEKLKQKEMHVNALQMQINPHFLYNMLDLIRWHTIHLEEGNGKVSQMIRGFSNMLRYNIKLGEGYATIEEEINYIKKYLELIQILYDKQIALSIHKENIPIEKIYINKLLFQPIIENTVVHGKISTVDNPLVEIKILIQEEQLIMDISNNGNCIEEERIAYINQVLEQEDDQHKSIGLKNVNQRIKLLFGEQYGLRLSKENEKINVRIRLPIKIKGKGR